MKRAPPARTDQAIEGRPENASRPLADRVRPETLDEYVGQAHLVGEGKPLNRILETGRLPSMILWGPPGVGKTTLARILANQTGRPFHELSAVSAGKDEIRRIVETTKPAAHPVQRDLFSEASLVEKQRQVAPPVLFLDEIHRFNKAQQDFLLPFVENGTLVLIGATTENPSFEVIPALLSRTRVFVLEPLSEDDIGRIVRRGAQVLNITLGDDVIDFLVRYAGGDARQALNLLQVASELYLTGDSSLLTIDHLQSAIQSRHIRYDKLGEEHYNTVSAFIKSMRASNADAALYYLARMVAAGEDPLFIARRLVIFASEDVGLADVHALPLANAVFRAVETIGYPEAQISLAHGTVYLARAPKSRASCDAFFSALEDATEHGALPIPMELRNAPTSLMKQLGYGSGYEMYTDRDLLPEALQGHRYLP
jgi:putative ATPase